VRRYHYTPRRNGRPVARSSAAPQRAFLPVLVPIVLVIGVLVAVGLITRSGGSIANDACQGETCDHALALGASSVPSVKPSSAASPQPTPFHSPYPVPAITGLSAAILEEPCGKQIHAFNASTRYPPASLAKLMTALVAANHTDLAKVITSPLDGVVLSEETDGTVMGLEQGEKMTLRDLLYGLLLRSGNDAALVIAQAIGGSVDGFVKMMNDEAASLGLTNTHFTNPHGLDDPHLYVSAHDIAVLGHEVLQQPDLADIVQTQTYTPAWDKGALENINLFLSNYPGAIGLKTGYTDTANQTIVAAATRNGRTLLVSVLHSEDEYVDAGALLDWAFDNTSPACAG
jgi:D-alanyl-D-alanine carboxypeptidase